MTPTQTRAADGAQPLPDRASPHAGTPGGDAAGTAPAHPVAETLPGLGRAAPLDWRESPQGAAPVSMLYDDPYFSIADGLAETRHVYLAAAALPARMAGRHAFRIGELGFGVGLATLCAWALWREVCAPGGLLHMTSFEAHPLGEEDLARAHAAFPELEPLAAPFRAAWSRASGDLREVDLPGLRLRVVIGDARRTVPASRNLLAQAWFLDGFAPKKNPALWEPELLSAVARRTAPGGTASTYSAAGSVRRALSDAGFTVEKRPGHGRKRDMTLARLRPEGAA